MRLRRHRDYTEHDLPQLRKIVQALLADSDPRHVSVEPHAGRRADVPRHLAAQCRPDCAVQGSRRASNLLLALTVVYPTITVPISAWLLMGFFKSVPPKTEEAKLCDGYYPYGAFLRVALPLARPGVISVIVFSLYEFITRSEWRTFSVGVPSELILGAVFFWQPLLASARTPLHPGLHRWYRQRLNCRHHVRPPCADSQMKAVAAR